MTVKQTIMTFAVTTMMGLTLATTTDPEKTTDTDNGDGNVNSNVVTDTEGTTDTTTTDTNKEDSKKDSKEKETTKEDKKDKLYQTNHTKTIS
ncbi:hypothetical protein ABM135_09290 [Enterococcus cecorum]|uniref:hypothetical protein n=1 Tax=Enterococcus cecorum TaxID=44008 RepID=UPI0032C460B5